MNETYEAIMKQVGKAYSPRSYKVDFYLGVKGMVDNIWITRHKFDEINVIAISLAEVGYSYRIHLGNNHYIRDHLSSVTFESDHILCLREVNKQIEVEISKWLKEGKVSATGSR